MRQLPVSSPCVCAPWHSASTAEVTRDSLPHDGKTFNKHPRDSAGGSRGRFSNACLTPKASESRLGPEDGSKAAGEGKPGLDTRLPAAGQPHLPGGNSDAAVPVATPHRNGKRACRFLFIISSASCLRVRLVTDFYSFNQKTFQSPASILGEVPKRGAFRAVTSDSGLEVRIQHLALPGWVSPCMCYASLTSFSSSTRWG